MNEEVIGIMKKIFISIICIFAFSMSLFAQDEETPTPAAKSGPLMLGLYGTIGFTLSGAKGLNDDIDWGYTSDNSDWGWNDSVHSTFGLGYSAGATFGYRVVDNVTETLTGIAPMLSVEFSGKNHKFSNYKALIGKQEQSIQFRTYFMDLLGGLRFILDPVYVEPGLYVGIPIKDWKYHKIDETVPLDNEGTLSKKSRKTDFGLYLQIGSLIPVTDNIFIDAGAHMRFGITRTVKPPTSNTESANRFFMAFRFGVMTMLEI